MFTFWRFVMGVALAVVVYGSLTPLAGVESFSGADKLVHSFVYAWLYILVWLAFPGAILRWEIHLVLLVFGILLEVAQAQTGYRTMEGADVLANVVGAGGGNIILFYFVNKLPGRFLAAGTRSRY